MKKVPLVFSPWYYLTANFQESPKTFHATLEVVEEIRQLPEVKISRVDYSDGGWLSPKRECWRAEGKEPIFDICSAPFGKGFFVSWWLGETASFFSSLPILRSLRLKTLYRLDTTLKFRGSVRSAVLEGPDAITKAKDCGNFPRKRGDQSSASSSRDE